MAHDYKREERTDDEGIPAEYRMRCRCGKRSQWTTSVLKVMIAQDRHADRVAGR